MFFATPVSRTVERTEFPSTNAATTLVFCSTLRVTPAMEAGISDHVWALEELCGLLPKANDAVAQIDKKLLLAALGD